MGFMRWHAVGRGIGGMAGTVNTDRLVWSEHAGVWGGQGGPDESRTGERIRRCGRGSDGRVVRAV